jgi:hypothetical protein
MNDRDYLVDIYRQQGQLLAMHVGDFSEAEMLVRPTENANHAAWQLGHCVAAFAGLINTAMAGAFRPEPQEFVDRHTGKGSKLNDGFAPKAELLQKFHDANERAIQWMLGLSDAEKARPIEKLKGFAPTVGHLVYVLPNHVALHVGQIQVIRRKVGKPILF